MSDANKYTVETYGPRIEQFLGDLVAKAGLELGFTVTRGVSLHPEIENPDLMVKFSGRDVDMLLENRAELMLALEHLTLELLRVPSDEFRDGSEPAGGDLSGRPAEAEHSAATRAAAAAVVWRPANRAEPRGAGRPARPGTEAGSASAPGRVAGRRWRRLLP